MAALAKLKEWSGFDALSNPQMIIGDVVRDPQDSSKVIGARIDPTRFNAVLAAFLYHEDRKITPEAAGALIEDLEAMGRVGMAIAEAWLKFAGPKKEADPLEPAAGENNSTSPESGQ